jgi:hypothetical protein
MIGAPYGPEISARINRVRTMKPETCPKTMAKRLRTACTTRRLSLLLLFALPAVVQAQFNYTTNNGTITITGYTGPGGDVTIPSATNGLPVTSIGSGRSLTVPA